MDTDNGVTAARGRYSMEKLLEAIGVHIFDVPLMPDPVCYVSTQRVGLIRAELAGPARDAALGWLFQRACRQDAPQDHPRLP